MNEPAFIDEWSVRQLRNERARLQEVPDLITRKFRNATNQVQVYWSSSQLRIIKFTLPGSNRSCTFYLFSDGTTRRTEICQLKFREEWMKDATDADVWLHQLAHDLMELAQAENDMRRNAQ